MRALAPDSQAAAALLVGATAAAEKPNVLLIMVDDLGYGDLSSYGGENLETPHIDKLMGEGMRFNEFYANCCVCSPTRCSAITGHWPSRHRIFAHLAYLSSNRQRHIPNHLDVSAPSLPRALQSAGYRTAMIGKWHLGGGSGRQFRGRPINDPDALVEVSLEGKGTHRLPQDCLRPIDN